MPAGPAVVLDDSVNRLRTTLVGPDDQGCLSHLGASIRSADSTVPRRAGSVSSPVVTKGVRRVPFGPGIWPGPCRQACLAGRGSRVKGLRLRSKRRAVGAPLRLEGPARTMRGVLARRSDTFTAPGASGAVLTAWPWWAGAGSGIGRGPQAAGHRGAVRGSSPRRRACVRRTRRKLPPPQRRDPRGSIAATCSSRSHSPCRGSKVRDGPSSALAATGALAKAVSVSRRVGLAGLSVPRGRAGTRSVFSGWRCLRRWCATPTARMAAGSNAPPGARA